MFEVINLTSASLHLYRSVLSANKSARRRKTYVRACMRVCVYQCQKQLNLLLKEQRFTTDLRKGQRSELLTTTSEDWIRHSLHLMQISCRMVCNRTPKHLLYCTNSMNLTHLDLYISQSSTSSS